MFLAEQINTESSKVISKAKRMFRNNNYNKGSICVLQSWSLKLRALGWMEGSMDRGNQSDKA